MGFLIMGQSGFPVSNKATIQPLSVFITWYKLNIEKKLKVLNGYCFKKQHNRTKQTNYNTTEPTEST